MLYINQKPSVSSKLTHPENGIIRVTFSGITLSLSLTDAFCLAANIHREIRTVEREHPEACGLTDAVRSNLKRGDVVRVRDDNGNEADYEVRRGPWFTLSGQGVIGLKGISGSYSLARVVKVIRYADPV